MKFGRLFLFSGLSLLIVAGCFMKPQAAYSPAPVLLPGTLPEMNTPGFWIARHPCPDSVLLTPEQIETSINAPVRDVLKAVRSLSDYPNSRKGTTLRADMQDDLDSFAGEKYYDERGHRLDAHFFDNLRPEMNLDAIPGSVSVRFALTVNTVNLRQLPTDAGVFARADEFDFDELQNSSFDPGTPLAVLWASRSGNWQFVATPYNRGWVHTDCIAFCSREEITRFSDPQTFVVNLRAKSDVYLDSAMTRFAGTIQMGTRLPLLTITGETVEVLFPQRDSDGGCELATAYMRSADVHEGYLPYTPRNAIEQAFEMLNAPYGWSGMFGEQDCSRFLQQTFACFGIQLPRKSTLQGKTGVSLAEFDSGTPSKEKAALLLSKAIGGVTILQMPGHVILYLGEVDGKPYAIHATWAYRERVGTHEEIRVINRVVVSDLNLGQHSHRGSLLFRLRNVRLLGRG